MKKTLTLEMPDHFTMACKFMEISSSEMLQEFIESILPAEKDDENDTLKQMLAIRYFLHYASDRNRAHERHSKRKTAFIQDCFMSLNGILGDFPIDDQSPIDQWRKEFITDWQIKWKGLDRVFDQHQSKEHGRTYILNRKKSASSIKSVMPYAT